MLFPGAISWQDLYNACPGWGWSEAKKRAELTHPSARYLVLFEQTAAAAGDGQHAAQHSGQDGSHTAAGDPAAAAAAADAGGRPSSGSQENAAAAGNGGGGSARPAGGACASAALGSPDSGQEQLGRLGQPLAFLHYRFEEEEGEAVLYCYEIQVVQAAQVGCQPARQPGVGQGPASGVPAAVP